MFKRKKQHSDRSFKIVNDFIIHYEFTITLKYQIALVHFTLQFKTTLYHLASFLLILVRES